MVGKFKKPPEGFLTLGQVVAAAKKRAVSLKLSTLKYRTSKGIIKGVVRDETDSRRRRLVPTGIAQKLIETEAVQKIILDGLKTGDYVPLSKLAKDTGFKERSLHLRAGKRGIKTIKVGNKRLLEKAEYKKWRIRLTFQIKNTVSTGFLGKKWGVSHNRIVYWIKRGYIPAKKYGSEWRISKKLIKKEEADWKKRCGL